MSQPQQPQSIDPCASIRQDIEDTKKTINDDQLELSHFPEDLTAAQKAQLMQEITDLKQKLVRLDAELAQCREQHAQSGSAEAVPSETGWGG
jgi:chromosome segregation ATPase